MLLFIFFISSDKILLKHLQINLKPIYYTLDYTLGNLSHMRYFYTLTPPPIHFIKILNAAGLRIGQLGQSRTMYCLRHTAITFRLLYGRGIDLLTLARNARTSVQMIEKFYASQLTAEMNINLLQSRR